MPDPQPITDDDRADLVAYLDGELEADAQRRVEARLNTDANARSEADTLKRAWELLDYLPRSEPSTDFTERTLDRVSALRASTGTSRSAVAPAAVPWYRRQTAFVASVAAAALLAFAVGYAVTPGPRPPPDVDPDTDPLMASEPRVIENLPLYLAADNLDYLLALDQSDLFADDGTGR